MNGQVLVSANVPDRNDVNNLNEGHTTPELPAAPRALVLPLPPQQPGPDAINRGLSDEFERDMEECAFETEPCDAEK